MAKRVLIVHDDPEPRTAYSNVLWYNGFDVEVGAAAEGLAEVVRASAPDLVLLGLAASSAAGLEACRVLTSSPDTRHIPVIVLSARPERDLARAARLAGCSTYLEEPIPAVEVLFAVERLIGRALPDEEERSPSDQEGADAGTEHALAPRERSPSDQEEARAGAEHAPASSLLDEKAPGAGAEHAPALPLGPLAATGDRRPTGERTGRDVEPTAGETRPPRGPAEGQPLVAERRGGEAPLVILEPTAHAPPLQAIVEPAAQEGPLIADVDPGRAGNLQINPGPDPAKAGEGADGPSAPAQADRSPEPPQGPRPGPPTEE